VEEGAKDSPVVDAKEGPDVEDRKDAEERKGEVPGMQSTGKALQADIAGGGYEEVPAGGASENDAPGEEGAGEGVAKVDDDWDDWE
jgi:hypothetical protein